jgi:hypothetical protein
MSKPYLPGRDQLLTNDEDWDRFMHLSDAEAEAEVLSHELEFWRFISEMDGVQQYRFWRHYILTSIMENRRRLRNPELHHLDIIDKIWRDAIRHAQRKLLQHRIHLKTGVWPGRGRLE